MVSGLFKMTALSGLVLLGNLLTGCGGSEENPPPITEERLLEVLPLGKAVPLTSLVAIDSNSTVCVLPSYSDRLIDGEPYESLVNDYLTSIGYRGSEGVWSIVWIAGDMVSITDIHRRNFELASPMLPGTHQADTDWETNDSNSCSSVKETYAYRFMYEPILFPGKQQSLFLGKRRRSTQ